MGDEHGDFAQGQEMEHAPGEHHEGDFAEGQERAEHEGHDEHHGNFAEGQETEHEGGHEETGFAEGQKERSSGSE